MAGLRTKVRALAKIVDELAEMMESDCTHLQFDRREHLEELRAYLASLDNDLAATTASPPAHPTDDR